MVIHDLAMCVWPWLEGVKNKNDYQTNTDPIVAHSLHAKPIKNAKIKLFSKSRTHLNFVVDKYVIELGHNVIFLSLKSSEIIPKAISQNIIKSTVFMKKSAAISDDPKSFNKL